MSGIIYRTPMKVIIRPKHKTIGTETVSQLRKMAKIRPESTTILKRTQF